MPTEYDWRVIAHGTVSGVRSEPRLKELVMTDLLGGQEVWNECTQVLSSMLRAYGLSDDDVRQVLSTDAVRTKMVELVTTARPGAKSATTPEIAALIPEGWSVFQDIPSHLFQFQELELLSFNESEEEYVNIETMYSRATKFGGGLSLADAAFMLENQQIIPEELQDSNIVFFGTVLRSQDGELSVPVLYWESKTTQWALDLYWFSFNWDDFDLMARCK